MAVVGISRVRARQFSLRHSIFAHRRIPLIAFLSLLLLVCLIILSLGIGSRALTPTETFQGLFSPSTTTESIIVWKLRLPRTLAAIVVGASLASAGVLMQALTRNPLAEPGLLGVNSGAAIAVVSAVAFFGITSTGGQVWFALAGAALAACLSFLLGSTRSRSQDSVTRLILAGVALNACFGSITGIITMFNSVAFDSHRFWVVGSVAERTYGSIAAVTPVILVGLVAGLLLIKPLSVLALGDDCAASLGLPLPIIRVTALTAITLLCGGATALAGPISFVGLAVPHALRILVGNKLSRLLPMSLIAGPILMLGADILGRVVAIPNEIEVGIVTAFIGAPILLWLVMRINSTPKTPRFSKTMRADCSSKNYCTAPSESLNHAKRKHLPHAERA